MSTFELRKMTPDELERVVGLWVRSRWDAEPWLEERMAYTHEQNLRHFRDVIARECAIWLACEHDQVVGLMAFADGRIDQLFVEPKHQGRGAGSALVDLARRLAPTGLTLFTHQRNERARAFYESRGFRAEAFGTSPAPESEPDVKYVWGPSPTASG